MGEGLPIGDKGDGTTYNALIIDDSVFMVKQISQILQSQKFTILGTAADGLEGLNKYKELHPKVDLVTLDITMPTMDGITCLEKILEFDKNAKVVMMSALGKEDLVKKALLLGAKGYIVKPLEREKILSRIQAVLVK